MKKGVIISGCLLVVGIMISVYLWINVNNSNVSYKKVNAVVSYVEIKNEYDLRKNREYVVKVRLNGKEQKLHNIRRGYLYMVGNLVEVVEADGVLYEDEDGARSHSKMAYFYFISLGVDLFLLVIFITFIAAYRRRSKYFIKKMTLVKLKIVKRHAKWSF